LENDILNRGGRRGEEREGWEKRGGGGGMTT